MRAPIDRLDVQRAKARAMMPGVANRPMGINPMAARAAIAASAMPRPPMSRPAPMMAPASNAAPPGGIMSQPGMGMGMGAPPAMRKGGSMRTKMGAKKKVAAFKKGGRFEGSPADKKQDAMGAKRLKMSVKDYEKTPEDAAEDAKGESMESYRKGGMKKAARSKMPRYAAGGAGKIRKGEMTREGAPIKKGGRRANG